MEALRGLNVLYHPDFRFFACRSCGHGVRHSESKEHLRETRNPHSYSKDQLAPLEATARACFPDTGRKQFDTIPRVIEDLFLGLEVRHDCFFCILAVDCTYTCGGNCVMRNYQEKEHGAVKDPKGRAKKID